MRTVKGERLKNEERRAFVSLFLAQENFRARQNRVERAHGKVGGGKREHGGNGNLQLERHADFNGKHIARTYKKVVREVNAEAEFSERGVECGTRTRSLRCGL